MTQQVLFKSWPSVFQLIHLQYLRIKEGVIPQFTNQYKFIATVKIMNYYDEINNAEYIYATKIFEPGDNSIELELTVAGVSDSEDPITLDTGLTLMGTEIAIDEHSTRYKIIFQRYIAYTVLNECFAELEESPCSGDNIKIYEESNFLNYLNQDTFASPIYPGAFKHYAFISLNHIIHVAAEDEPIIEKII